MPMGHCRDPLTYANQSIVAAGTTTGPSMALPDGLDWVGIQINTSATGGTSPNVTYTVQWSMDNTTWADADATAADAFTAVTAVTVAVKRFTVKAPYCRIKAVTTGTNPTATWAPTVFYR